ncbi:MAG: hypothetical protein NT073_19110 [Spirosoma sp.]|nr:hypothetical protein [Spirosoma sp.]
MRKNKLWDVYQNAAPLVHSEILLELKKQNLYRHWQTVASKEGYDLHLAKAPLRDIFLKVMPETAPYFGVTLPSTLKTL